MQINLISPPIPKQNMMHWDALPGASLGLALNNVIAKNHTTTLILTPDTATAHRIGYELEFFQRDTTYSLLHFPDWETLPYDYFSPHQDIISSRLATLYQLPLLKQGVLITSITTLMQRLPPENYLAAHTFFLHRGEKINLDEMRLRLEKAGYRYVPSVREHGEFAVRGSLIDLFPMGSGLPYRIDLFDNEIDSIRTFSPETQRSLEQVEKIELLPAKEFPINAEAIEFFRQEWRSEFSGNPLNCPIYQDMSEGICTPGLEYYLPLFFKETATLFNYLPKNSLLICVGDLFSKAQEFWQEIQTRYTQRSHDVTRPILAPSKIFLDPDAIQQCIENYSRIFTPIPTPAIFFSKEEPTQTELKDFLSHQPGRLLFCAESLGRREMLLQLLHSLSLYPKFYASWNEFVNDTEPYGLIIAHLDDGLKLEHPALMLITENQLFGKRIMQRRRRKETTQDTQTLIKNLTELQIGAPIVHIDHGVGRYQGLQVLNVGEQLTEFLCLEYLGGDKLYVPISSLHLINRYSGMDPEHAPLNKLGTPQWQKAKRKAAEQVRDVAAELLEVYAKREAHPGFQSAAPDEQYAAFAAAFPFEETPDQQLAIEQVIADMQLAKPMDRLICGDVGFGKTEVAMRAAFIAVQNNKQVAILVPTTLLAEQHYQNFLDRFANWPFNIQVLSRFKSAKQQQKIFTEIAAGKVDIIVGTHILLQEKVQFKSLGLVIIDEEHRFGVRQKERLKSLRHEVDILTLTATPIPRTLNMAFANIRDFSIIATPPARRLSVKTFVQEYQNQIIKEAISRELLRGGQVYFVYNEVASISKMARDLEKLVPEARISIAHGQMREHELETVMADFYHRRSNILVCSTIIESGIDIPSANTIIINRADKFGLAQLHQLRGRVGRSHHQAYAYLLTPSRNLLTKDAEKRLDAIASLEDLGVGFSLATHDLEIRGAGELLGDEQSGNMHAVGFSLYMELLSRAVEALRLGKQPALETVAAKSCEIDLQIPALIPENYLGDVHLRLQLYKRIASAQTISELDEIQIEMIDRFGLLPEAAKNIFAIAELKLFSDQLGIIKIEANAKNGKIEFTEKPNIEPIKIIQLLQKKSGEFRLDGPTRLRFQLPTHERKDRINLIREILSHLE